MIYRTNIVRIRCKITRSLNLCEFVSLSKRVKTQIKKYVSLIFSYFIQYTQSPSKSEGDTYVNFLLRRNSSDCKIIKIRGIRLNYHCSKMITAIGHKVTKPMRQTLTKSLTLLLRYVNIRYFVIFLI